MGQFLVKKTGSSPDVSCNVTVSSQDGPQSTWRVPEETPVAFVFNRRNYAVMLATPDNLVSFAVGFSLAERIIEKVSDILEVELYETLDGIDVRVKISPERLELLDIRQERRNLIGRTGCGICGIENADVFFEVLPCVSEHKANVSNVALLRSMKELNSRQPLNQQTRTVHAAAWVDARGGIQFVCEDVGRHNALDKLVGTLACDNVDVSSGFVLMSSRCSYEIIEKAARFGIRAVASISAPTAFAIRKAKEANITLYCRDGDGFVEVK